jgi:hypothetical protein
MPPDSSVLQNRYCILRTLSDKGWMGVVYQAEDQRLGSTVVVKETRHLQMKPEVRDLVLKAFFRESRLPANLPHPALPPSLRELRNAYSKPLLSRLPRNHKFTLARQSPVT